MGVQQSLRFRTVLGDWSDDGHGKTAVNEIEVFTTDPSVVLTEELVQANAAANLEKLGFSLEDLWPDYEQGGIYLGKAEAIQEKLGAIYYTQEDGLIESFSSIEIRDFRELGRPLPLNFGEFLLEEAGGGDFVVDSELGLVLFIILQGIPGVGWRKVQSPLLFGGYTTLVAGNDAVGYGLFF